MRGLSRRIMEHARRPCRRPRRCVRPPCLHLGNRAAVDQALSRLARSGHLMRICQGVYMRPIETRFGVRAPRVAKADRRAVADVGRNDRAVRRRGGQLPAPHHAESGPCGLPHLRSQPTAALRLVRCRAASRAALAAGGAAPKGGRRHPRPRMARLPKRSRMASKRYLKTLSEADREELAAAQGHHADLDGGAGERAPCAWLRRGIPEPLARRQASTLLRVAERKGGSTARRI